jgi:RHS repeat-associated protein
MQGQLSLDCTGAPDEESVTHRYDANGNQVTAGPSSTFSAQTLDRANVYDHEDRLLRSGICLDVDYNLLLDYGGDVLAVVNTATQPSYPWQDGMDVDQNGVIDFGADTLAVARQALAYVPPPITCEETAHYWYNGDGLRVRKMDKQAGGGATDHYYTWDPSAGSGQAPDSALPVVLQETAAGQTTYYVYGLDLLYSIQGSTPTYYLTDGLGSTTELADNNGDVVATYEYDVFGAFRSQSGSSANPWLFTGQQRDAESGFYYLRARYYDPAVGRFLSRDPWPGSVFSPLSLNPYAYVLNNPLRWLDPWGLCSVEGTPTPTPVGMVQVCTASPAGCEPTGRWVEIPRGGETWALFPAINDVLGDVLGAYKAYYRHTPDYLLYQHVVRPVLQFATSRSPQCYVSGGIELGAVGAMILAPETAPVFYPISLGFAEPAATSCFAQ